MYRCDRCGLEKDRAGILSPYIILCQKCDKEYKVCESCCRDIYASALKDSDDVNIPTCEPCKRNEKIKILCQQNPD